MEEMVEMGRRDHEYKLIFYFEAEQKLSCYYHFDGFFDRTIPSKIPFPFPWNPYLKTDGTNILILFLVKNLEEYEIEFLKERFCQKLPSNK